MCYLDTKIERPSLNGYFYVYYSVYCTPRLFSARWPRTRSVLCGNGRYNSAIHIMLLLLIMWTYLTDPCSFRVANSVYYLCSGSRVPVFCSYCTVTFLIFLNFSSIYESFWAPHRTSLSRGALQFWIRNLQFLNLGPKNLHSARNFSYFLLIVHSESCVIQSVAEVTW